VADSVTDNSRPLSWEVAARVLGLASGLALAGQRPPHRSIVGEVADRIDDVAHAPAGRAGRRVRPARPGARQQRYEGKPRAMAGNLIGLNWC